MIYTKVDKDEIERVEELITPNLRWAVSAGDTIDKRRLQQAWVIVTHHYGLRIEEKTEWRDVPTEFVE